MEENQSSTLESMIIDEVHLDCSKHYEMLNHVENMHYINSKHMEEHIEAMTNNLDNQNESICKKKGKTEGQHSSQCLLYEAMTEKFIEDNASGLKPSSANTICNNSHDSKAKAKEVEVKPTGEH